jgi:ABC-2 type transport system ATP-binding protein
MSNAIEIRGLTWRPGRSFALRELDLTVPAVAIYGFLGPNGSGKTSTIRLLLGMARPQAGRVTVLGGSVPRDLPAILARTGYVPETSHLYPGLTVEESLGVHRAFFRSWDGAWAEALRKAFRLEPGARVGRLSKGERGKLLILLALAQRPDLLVLDEPTDGLDPVVRRDVLTATLEYVSETGATVFISSHLVHELERFCDWVGVLENGTMLAEMPMATFKSGIKRLRLSGAPAAPLPPLPFLVLARQPGDGMAAGETWIVRGWEDGMAESLAALGVRVREVVHLDLEEGFVELLRAARPEVWAGANGQGRGLPTAPGTASSPAPESSAIRARTGTAPGGGEA